MSKDRSTPEFRIAELERQVTSLTDDRNLEKRLRKDAEDAAQVLREQVTSLTAELAQKDQEIVQLRALTTWQPIETAPKDGTWVSLYVRWQDKRDIVGSGQWTKDGEGRYCWFWPWSNPPTHWKPLPDPPLPHVAPREETP